MYPYACVHDDVSLLTRIKNCRGTLPNGLVDETLEKSSIINAAAYQPF